MKILALTDTHLGFQVGSTAEARRFTSENMLVVLIQIGIYHNCLDYK